MSVYVRSGEHGSSQTETEYNFNLRNNLMRVNSDTLLFGTVIKKKPEKNIKAFKICFFKSIENNTYTYTSEDL